MTALVEGNPWVERVLDVCVPLCMTEDRCADGGVWICTSVHDSGQMADVWICTFVHDLKQMYGWQMSGERITWIDTFMG